MSRPCGFDLMQVEDDTEGNPTFDLWMVSEDAKVYWPIFQGLSLAAARELLAAMKLIEAYE